MEVRRSRNRRKTVSARLVNGTLVVLIPAWMSKADERKWVEDMKAKVLGTRSTDSVDLGVRAAALAVRHRLEQPASIRWVTNQLNRWGSCTPADRTIRISSRLANVPEWVLDYVIVHELAHLTLPDHSPAFWALADRYPKTERAKGFLEGLGMAMDEGWDIEGVPAPASGPDGTPGAIPPPVPLRPRRLRPAIASWEPLPGFGS